MKTRLAKLLRGVSGPAHPWRPEKGVYPALAAFDPAVIGPATPGLYALWHLGVRPRWLHIGGAADLAAAIARAKQHAQIKAAIVHGGVYLAWAPLPVAEIPPAVAALVAAAKPYLQSVELAGEIRAGGGSSSLTLPPGALESRG